MFPDGITKHMPQEAKDSRERAADFYEEERKAAAMEAAAHPSKEGVDVDEFGDLNDKDDPVTEVTEARIHASTDELLLQAQTRCDPGTFAELRAQVFFPVPKKPKQGELQPQARCIDLHRNSQWELLDQAQRVDGS